MILVICGIAMLPVNEYLKSAILVVALGMSCLLYHVENRAYEGNPITRFINRHITSWDWDDDRDDDESHADRETDAEVDERQQFAEPYHEVAKASIDIDFGAGDLNVKAPCAELVKADIVSNYVKYSFRSEQGDDNTAIYLTGNSHGKKLGRDNKNNLDLALCTQPIWDFNLDMGAADAELDFSPYKMGNIKINGGACNLDLKLGDNGCDTKVSINTGASDIDIKVPSSVDCQVNIESAIIGKEFIGFEKIERGVWRTPGFGQGSRQITIDLSSAVSDLSVERY